MTSVTAVDESNSADEIRQVIETATGGWVLIGPADRHEAFRRELSEWDQDAAAILWERTSDSLADAVRSELPPGLRLLVRVPLPGETLALRVEAVRQAGGVSQGEELPLWGLLLRLAEQGDSLRWAVDPQPAASPEVYLPRLVPQRPSASRRRLVPIIRRLCAAATGDVKDSVEAAALLAGWLQWHDFLDESHECSQSIEHEGRHRNGDYWHAIMHRREPDFGNSKYWFHHVGRHPVFSELADRAATILADCSDPRAAEWSSRLIRGGEWQPSAFVDLCSECVRDEDQPLSLAARALQRTEMLLLLRQTARDAGVVKYKGG